MYDYLEGVDGGAGVAEAEAVFRVYVHNGGAGICWGGSVDGGFYDVLVEDNENEDAIV